jgi:hypothetical protein
MTKHSTHQPDEKATKRPTVHQATAVDPVIIDDGGSIRLRRNDGANGKMDALLDGSFSFPKAAATHLEVTFVATDGTNQAGSNIPNTLGAGDTITVVSGNYTVTFVNGSSNTDSTITVSGANPIIEAKSHNGKRRYAVSNSGPSIDTITYTPNGGTQTTTVFDQRLTPSDYTYIRLS